MFTPLTFQWQEISRHHRVTEARRKGLIATNAPDWKACGYRHGAGKTKKIGQLGASGTTITVVERLSLPSPYRIRAWTNRAPNYPSLQDKMRETRRKERPSPATEASLISPVSPPFSQTISIKKTFFLRE